MLAETVWTYVKELIIRSSDVLCYKIEPDVLFHFFDIIEDTIISQTRLLTIFATEKRFVNLGYLSNEHVKPFHPKNLISMPYLNAVGFLYSVISPRFWKDQIPGIRFTYMQFSM